MQRFLLILLLAANLGTLYWISELTQIAQSILDEIEMSDPLETPLTFTKPGPPPISVNHPVVTEQNEGESDEDFVNRHEQNVLAKIQLMESLGWTYVPSS